MEAEPARFIVFVCNIRRDMPVHIAHGFGSQRKAEQFAMAISRFFAPKPPNAGPEQWALVHAVATAPPGSRWFGESYCYLAVDPGGEVVKRLAIPSGFHGHRPARAA